MPYLKVYHNPHFLFYDGDHSQIILPIQPVATVMAPDSLPLPALLEVGYAQTQHGYDHDSWFNNPQVLTHLRSTSVGDLITDGDGNLYVVERVGFQPYQPQAIAPAHRLAEGYRLLQAAVAAADIQAVLPLVQQGLVALQHALVAADYYPASESPPGGILHDDAASPYCLSTRRIRLTPTPPHL